MKHAFRLLTALLVAGFLLAAVVLGGYLAFSQASQGDKTDDLLTNNQTFSCEQVLGLLSEQAQAADCSNLPDSSACYGHSLVRYEPSGAESVAFEKPGDQELLNKLKTISTGPLDLETGEWGVALLRTRLAENGRPVNAPPVIFMLYGATTMENISPDTNAPANGSSPEGLHAFYFDTRGLGLTTECRELPVGGIAIESPEGYRVSFTANEVEILIGSTVVLQAEPYAEMHVTVLEGQAAVTAAGGTVTVGVGQQALISMGGQNGLQADEPPQVRTAGPAVLALPNICQFATWSGISLPCSMPPVALPTPTVTPLPSPTAPPTPSPVPSPVGPYVTANVNANVRAGDDTVFGVVGALLTGQTAPVLGLSCTGSGWYYIQLSGRQGFISSVVVTLSGSTVGLPCYNPPPRPTPTPPDSDGDGFIDAVDRCPVSYAPNSTDGCPPPTPTVTPALRADLVVALPQGAPAIDCSSSLSSILLVRQGGSSCTTVVEVTVRNISHGSAVQAFTVEVTATGGGYWSTTVNGLAGGGSRTFVATLQTSCYQPDCTINAVVDAGNTVPELDETNNVASRTFIG